MFILCNIHKGVDIDFRFVEEIFKNEVEVDYVNTLKFKVNKIVSILKTDGYYSGEELEFATTLLHDILKGMSLIINTFDSSNYGIDFLNIKVFTKKE